MTSREDFRWGAVRQVRNRGDWRERFVRDDSDRRLFFETLAEACAETDWQIYVLWLRATHFHPVFEMPRVNPVAGRRWFLGASPARFDRRHKVVGHSLRGANQALVQ